jgi:hypothetical protein
MRLFRIALFVALATLVLAGVALADTNSWDVTADFSITNGNPNGVWSYGYMNTDFTGFTLFTRKGMYHAPDFINPAWDNPGNTAGIWKNNSGLTGYGVPQGWLSLHPGSSYQPCVARWTAPTGLSGTISIVGEFLAGDGGKMKVAVRKSGTEIMYALDNGKFNLTQNISSNEIVTIDFMAYGGYAYGNTPLTAKISRVQAVPEPATLLGFGLPMLMIGLGKLRGLRK